MNAKKPHPQTEGVTLKSPWGAAPGPTASTTEAAGQAPEGMSNKLSVSEMDPDVLSEIRGFVYFLAPTRGRDGLRTMGNLLTAALSGKGGLPTWRKKYNNGEPFQMVAAPNPDRPGRVTITGVDPVLLAEARGFAIWLSQHGAQDGLSSFADIVEAAYAGRGSLPRWRKKYNDGEKFPLSQYLPPGRK